MDDVKPTDAPASTMEAPVETETTQPEPQQAKETVVEPKAPATPQAQPVPEMPADRSVPYKRFSEVNSKYKEAQRKLAELERTQQYGQYDPNDLNTILSHPVVQELMIKQAKSELTDYTKELLEQYPSVHPQVKKAILSNVRGFVKENTSDVESAKLDIADYIESIIQEQASTQPEKPKNFPVASTNAPTATKGVKPAEVEKILSKAVDSWTDEEAKMVEDYTKSLPK